MRVEILYFDGCPNHEPLVARVPAVLRAAGIEAEVVSRRVESERDARALRFLGSPTVRVDGRDVEPEAATRSDYGLKCRLYRSAEGVSGQPADHLIAAAARG
ncbi:MAG TPA: hypothetical protein VFW09_05810 [Solirubrobacteraceae bacterium]|nr:hypothetical protein [Solirubrobacteraceae bacterium]